MKATFTTKDDPQILILSTKTGTVPCVWKEKEMPLPGIEYHVSLDIEKVQDIIPSEAKSYRMEFEEQYSLTAKLVRKLVAQLYLFQIDTNQAGNRSGPGG